MKKKLILLSTSLIYISPISIISCTNNSLYDQSSVNAQQVFTNVQSGQIRAFIDNNIKINNIQELENISLNFAVNKVENPSNTQQKLYEELENAINNINCKIVGFYLPKFNEDLNSSVFIKFNNKDNLTYELSINKIQQNNATITLNNLSEDKIQTLAHDKLMNDENLIINNLKNFFDQNVVQKYLMNKNLDSTLTFDLYWKNEESNIINNLTNFLIKMYPHYFSSSYQNLYLSIEKPIENKDSIKIPNILISTSNIATYPNCAISIGGLTIYFK